MTHSTRAAAASVLFLTAVASFSACGGDDGAGGTGGEGGAGTGGDGTTSTGTGPDPDQSFFLRIEDEGPPPVVLDLDKDKALEVFGVEAAKQIRLLDVDSTPLLTNVLTTIQNACGTAWQANQQNPMHDCSLTPLGQSFGPSWQTSPGFAMVRLLSMTPANADVTGTSLADFAALIEQNPGTFAFTFADVLSESLGITKTSPFIPTSQLVIALQRHLLGTHPEIGNQAGTMPITMYDALLDMAPLSEKLGPVGPEPWSGPGQHPGVLVPDDATFTTRSDALLPSFKMRVVAESNLRWVSGIDLSEGGGDMYLREGDSVLHFDFNDPQKLQITGVADSPTMDMRFRMHEVPGVVPSCTQSPACKSNYPPPMGNPVGAGTIWTRPEFLLEPIVAHAGLLTYGTRAFTKCYLVLNNNCLVGVGIGANGDPPGWTVFTNSLGGVQVPQPQFIWELLTEVAQVALHDPTGDGNPDIPEGAAEPVFALHGVPIGLSGEELIAQIRPTLQSQADLISDFILGRYWTNNDPLDFYYRRGEPGGVPYLYFVDPSDAAPDPSDPGAPRPYTYDKPGFFTSPDLSAASKVSQKVVDNVDDTSHEKYRLPPGETTLYMQDDSLAVYAVTFFVPEGADPVEIAARIKKM
ncbi:MAG: hypothetical protein IT372_10105 [Polyangiaceae bacterium]|nr:hypothetical protein [Polyangiaceae bacterium]